MACSRVDVNKRVNNFPGIQYHIEKLPGIAIDVDAFPQIQDALVGWRDHPDAPITLACGAGLDGGVTPAVDEEAPALERGLSHFFRSRAALQHPFRIHVRAIGKIGTVLSHIQRWE